MQSTLASRWVVILVFASVVLAPDIVHAQDEQALVITPFSGEGRMARVADQARDASVDALADWFKLVTDEAYEEAARTAGQDGTETERYAGIAQSVGAHVILTGSVAENDDGSASLSLTTRSGRDGAVLEATTIALPRRRIDRSVRDTLGAEVPKLILKAFNADKERIEQEEAEKQRLAEAEARQKREAEETARREAEEKAKARLEAERQAREAAERERREKLRLRGGVVAGLAITDRNLSFSTDENPAPEPYGYDGATTSGVRVAAEVFPLGLFGVEPLVNLGVTGYFDRTLVLETEFQDEAFATAQTRWGAGLRYLFPFGDSVDTAPAVQAAVGFNSISHTIDSPMVVVPDVTYTFVDLGVGVRVPFNERLRARALVRYLLILSAGAISEPENYGDTSTLGVDIDAGVDFLVMPMLRLGAGIQFTRISLSFGGDGALSMDPMGVQYVNGGSDTYLGAYLAAGYNF